MYALLADIGSTYTKLCAVDLDSATLLGTSAVLTTQNDIRLGVDRAWYKLKPQLPLGISFDLRRAASSAAGGLRLVAIGLVPELTGEAARMAALGAGAKVLKVYGHRLLASDLQEIGQLAPDIVLLAGGTDGGDRETLLANARALATTQLETAIVIAGNREAADEAEEILRNANFPCQVADNVLPRLGRLEVDGARQAIRELFLKRIVLAKGLQELEANLGEVVMPTPAAVLAGLELYAAEKGDLLAVDLGGATTDVYSIAPGYPADDAMQSVGLMPPSSYRTVEADIGMRGGASGVINGAGSLLAQLARGADLSVDDWAAFAATISQPNWLPTNELESRQEQLLARACVQLAVNRHVGQVEVLATPQGRSYLLRGKDLRSLRQIIGIGGALKFSPNPDFILAGALQQPGELQLMKPVEARFLLDADYVLFAAGLLASSHPESALQLLEQTLRPLPSRNIE